MGQAVVHFEVIGRDGDKLRNYYSELFGWEIDANNPMNYGVCSASGTQIPRVSGSAAASREAPRDTTATSPSTSS